MDPMDVLNRIAAVEQRTAGSDAERRAARLLAAELRALGRRGVRTQTIWVRPFWPAVHALLAAVGVAASVVSVDHPETGLGLAVAALVLLMADLSGRFTALRLLTPARATQNVVSLDRRADAPVRLVLTAAADTPRSAALTRGAGAGATARLRARLRGHLPSVHGVVLLSLVAVGACCAVRTGGTDARWLGALQLVPTVALLGCVGLLVDRLTAQAGREGAAANAGAAAVVLALVDALQRRPPASLAVDVVFAGADDALSAGMRSWVAQQRRDGVRAEEICVMHIAASGTGRPVWWTADGPVLALGYHPRLIAHCEATASDERHLGARAHQTRSTSPARAARAAGWPAIALGGLPETLAAPCGDEDAVHRISADDLRAVIDLAIGVIARLDAELADAPAAAGEPVTTP